MIRNNLYWIKLINQCVRKSQSSGVLSLPAIDKLRINFGVYLMGIL